MGAASPAEPFDVQLARKLDPAAWSDDGCLLDEQALDVQRSASLLRARELMPFLAEHGLSTEPKTLGEALEYAGSCVAEARDALNAYGPETRGDLRDIIFTLGKVGEDIQEQADDIVCDECGGFNNDGEGFDGRCGNCADRATDGEGEDLDIDNADEVEDDEVDPSIRYASFYLRDVEDFRGAVYDGSTLKATTLQLYGTGDEALAAARRLHVGNEERFLDSDQIDQDEANASWSYTVIFYDDEDAFRGVWLVDGEVEKTTDILYRTPAGARLAARDLPGDAA